MDYQSKRRCDMKSENTKERGGKLMSKTPGKIIQNRYVDVEFRETLNFQRFTTRYTKSIREFGAEVAQRSGRAYCSSNCPVFDG